MCPRVGMFILGWHVPAYTAITQMAHAGLEVVTVEDVLRSNGARTLDEVLPQAYRSTAANMFYQATPQDGPYCFYRHRPGEQSPPYPDCPNIERNARKQAQLLVDAGVDYAVLDATNLFVRNAFSDAIELRPFEVLAEEWSAARRSGLKTPDLAIWQAIPTGADLQEHFLAIYNNPAFDSLILRDPHTGKKVFFYVDPPDAARWPDPVLVASVASDGGKNDVVTVPMWAYADHVGPWPHTRGVWQFMAACLTNGQRSTAITDAPCDQPYTASSAIGSSVTVSPSYQMQYASAPFGSSGKRGGLVLRKQFERALAVRPEWLFISSWNEHVAAPFEMSHGIRSMGLDEDPTAGTLGFVDTYGVEFSRDLEPTLQGGSDAYELLRSCLRVYRSGATTCSSPHETCCQGGNGSANYTHVYSLMYGDNTTTGTGHVTVTSRAEVDALVAQGWREICVRGANDGPFCHDVNEPDPNAGPFILFAQPGTNRAPLYRCELHPGRHFMTLNAQCESMQVPGVLLGYVSTVKGGETLRPLWRCFSTTIGHTFSLTGTCTASNRETIKGYVR